MIIIADGGSTKTNWCLINESGKKVYFNTEGYNPFYVNTEYVIQSLENNLPVDLEKDKITEVNYYGSGVHNDEKAQIIADGMQAVFTKARVYVGHDLLAAARALLGVNSGFAAILGTGTNTCVYDGKDITYHIDSLAFILGDEGSGAYIGKKILSDYVRGYMPEPVRKSFWNTFQLTPDDVIETIYTKSMPNRFAATFSKFVYDNMTHIEYMRAIVKNSFNDFFKNIVSHYPNYQTHKFNCIGSVAYNFRNVLEEVAHEWGMEVGRIIRSPIDDLVRYHVELAPSASAQEKA